MFSTVGEIVGDATIIVSLILIVIFSLLVSIVSMIKEWRGIGARNEKIGEDMIIY